MDLNRHFSRLAAFVAHRVGTPSAFAICVGVVLVWAVTGPVFGFSDTWQLVINTGTTIVTFLMVFLIQNTQNRDGAAIQIKLDELILTSKAENDFIGIERLTDRELEALHERCATAARQKQDLAAKATAVLHARKTGDKVAPKRAPAKKKGRPPAPRRGGDGG